MEEVNSKFNKINSIIIITGKTTNPMSQFTTTTANNSSAKVTINLLHVMNIVILILDL